MSEEMAIRKVEDEIFDFIDLLGGISVCTKKNIFNVFFFIFEYFIHSQHVARSIIALFT